MFKFIAFVVLLSATSKLGQSKEDPVTRVNSYVAGAFSEFDSLAEQFEDIRTELEGYKHKGERVRNIIEGLLAVELKLISHKESCEELNLEALRKALFWFETYDSQSFEGAKRELPLNRFLLKFTKQAFGNCLEKFKSDIESLPGEEERGLIRVLASSAMKAKDETEPSEGRNISVDKKFDENEIVDTAKNMYCHIEKIEPCDYRFEGNYEEAKIYLQKYLFDPCREFKSPKNWSRTKAITLLSNVSLRTNYYPDIELEQNPMKWPAAVNACYQLSLRYHLDMFANIISK